MKFTLLLTAFSLAFAGSLPAEDIAKRAGSLSREEMQSTVEFLSADALEGRAPGERGGDLAEIYLQSIFKLLGLRPGAGASYFQSFTMKGFNSQNLTLECAGQKVPYLDEMMASCTMPQKSFNVEGEAVFGGFGIRTGNWNWDDYKNTDLKGKILILRANDPGLFIPDIFEGKKLTYFGRWSYKMEEAAKTGAAGVLLIHTDETAGYGWHVVRNSWEGEKKYLPSSVDNNLKFRGWIKEASLRKILASRGIDLDGLYQKALNREFVPIPLGFTVKLSGENDFRDLQARNVIGEIPGRSGKKIVVSAHIDHLGMNPRLSDDNIFNGAIDNGSAVAAMVLVAKVLQDCHYKPYHTLTFLGCQAEEEGLLGSRFYVQTANTADIITDINFESTPVWEKSGSFFGVGAGYSTLEDMLKAIVQREGLEYSEFSMSDQGFFYRSDQFPFAQKNIPAVWLSAGEKFASGQNHLRQFFTGNYHTVKDEFDPNWELESLRQTVKIAVELIDRLNTSRQVPHWKARLPFPVEK